MNTADSVTEFEKVDCVLCGSSEHELQCTIGQHGLPAHVVLCKRCGLGFLNPRWTEERYSRFYAMEYDKYYRTYLIGEKGGNASGAQVQPTIPALVRMKQAGILPVKIDSVLDIGSGSGGFLLQMKGVYPSAEFYAIEPSRNCQEVLRKSGITLVSDTVNSDWDKSFHEKFDFINMRHVLEHFLNPLEVLTKVRGSLKENGLVYIAVPNSAKPGLPLLRYFFRAVHTYYFNRPTLLALAQRAGLHAEFILEGDAFNRHELVLVFSKGEIINEIPSAYAAQHDVFAPIIKHESSFLYKLKQVVKKALGRESNNTAD